jgi:hypothetical protein
MLILFGLILYDVIRHTLRIDLGLIGIAIGMIIGIFTSRMYHISWNTDVKKVVSRLDIYGIGIIILYILLEVNRGKIVGYFTHDFEVTTIGFAVLTGIMAGRVIGTRGKILQILKEQKIFR